MNGNANPQAFELQNILSDLDAQLGALLTVARYVVSSHSALDAIGRAAEYDNAFEVRLTAASPLWRDPDANGDALSALADLLSFQGHGALHRSRERANAVRCGGNQ